MYPALIGMGLSALSNLIGGGGTASGPAFTLPASNDASTTATGSAGQIRSGLDRAMLDIQSSVSGMSRLPHASSTGAYAQAAYAHVQGLAA